MQYIHIKSLLNILFLLLALTGCSIYDKIDSRLHSTPEIGEKVDYQLNKYSNGRLDINFTVFVTGGDIAMFYYSCKTEDGWDSEREVGTESIIGGKAVNMHVSTCNTTLLIEVIAYNNFNKRSQKQNGKAWMIDLDKLSEPKAEKKESNSGERF